MKGRGEAALQLPYDCDFSSWQNETRQCFIVDQTSYECWICVDLIYETRVLKCFKGPEHRSSRDLYRHLLFGITHGDIQGNVDNKHDDDLQLTVDYRYTIQVCENAAFTIGAFVVWQQHHQSRWWVVLPEMNTM